jgi:hypothetical protein
VGADPGEQLGEPERLGQVVVGAGVQPDDHVDLLPPGRQHDDHQPRLRGPEPPAQLDAVHVRQLEVKQHQVMCGSLASSSASAPVCAHDAR